MPLYGVCKDCGHETIDYCCPRCEALKIERLEKEIERLLHRKDSMANSRTDEGIEFLKSISDALGVGHLRIRYVNIIAEVGCTPVVIIEHFLDTDQPRKVELVMEAYALAKKLSPLEERQTSDHRDPTQDEGRHPSQPE